MVGTKATVPTWAQAWRSEATSFAIRISAKIEELAATLHRAQPADQQLEIGVALDEVEVFRVHRQYRRRVVVVEEARVALRQHSEILLAKAALVAGGAATHPLGEDRRLRLQVDDQVRHGRARAQGVVHLLV